MQAILTCVVRICRHWCTAKLLNSTSLSRIPVSMVNTLAAVSVSGAGTSSCSSSLFSFSASPSSVSGSSSSSCSSDLSCSETVLGSLLSRSGTAALTLKASSPNLRRRSKTTWRAVTRTSSWSSWATCECKKQMQRFAWFYFPSKQLN